MRRGRSVPVDVAHPAILALLGPAALFTWPVMEYVTYSRFRRDPRRGWLHAVVAFVLCLFLNFMFADAAAMSSATADGKRGVWIAAWTALLIVAPVLVFLFRRWRWRRPS